MTIFQRGLASGIKQKVKKEWASARSYIVTEIQTGLTKERPPKQTKNLRASSAGLCARKNVLDKQWITPYVISYASNVTMTVGTAVHEVLQKYLLSTEHMVLAEHRYTWDELKLSGHVDGLNIDPVLRIPYIQDFKTCGKLPTSPKYEHVKQLHVYSLLSGIRGENSLELTYISRHFPHKMKTFSVFNDETFKNTVQLIVESVESLATGIVPNRPFTSKTHCTYCSHIDWCWKDENEITSQEPLPADLLAYAHSMLPKRFKETLFAMLYSGYITDNARIIIQEHLDKL